MSHQAAMDMSHFIAEYHYPPKREYVQLAFDNWDLSNYFMPKQPQFLPLVMALEILFNPGRSEIRYRVSRSMAVLLGKNREKSVDLEKEVKCLYDLRSELVHSGKLSNLDGP